MLSAAMVNLGRLRGGAGRYRPAARWPDLVVAAGVRRRGASRRCSASCRPRVATDLKALLAYSTVENMGLIFLGVGAAGLLFTARCHRRWPAVAVGRGAAARRQPRRRSRRCCSWRAGSVAAGDRPARPGRARRAAGPHAGHHRPVRIGALGAAALPPGNGFVSEWLLLQSLVHACRRRRRRHRGRDAARRRRGRADGRAGRGHVRQGVRASGFLGPAPRHRGRGQRGRVAAGDAGRDGGWPRRPAPALAAGPGPARARRCPGRSARPPVPTRRDHRQRAVHAAA